MKIKKIEEHYNRLYDNVNKIHIYLCPSIADMNFIPKEECHNGDIAKIGKGLITFKFRNGRWEKCQ